MYFWVSTKKEEKLKRTILLGYAIKDIVIIGMDKNSLYRKPQNDLESNIIHVYKNYETPRILNKKHMCALTYLTC